MSDSPYVLAKDGLPARKSGRWAQRKHYYLSNYCGITTKAMKRKFRLVYLDVMAGPGRCKLEETGEEFPGSPFVALEHDFAEYVFIEADDRLVDALRSRVKGHPKAKRIRVIQDDWSSLAESKKLFFDETHLVVAFVDPTGISQVPMSSILSLTRSPRIDLLLTIQYRLSIVWNAPIYKRCQETETALDRFLDARDWRDWDDKDSSEFGRKAIDFFCDRLVKEGFLGTRHVSVPEQNPLYRFTLFSRNKRGEDFWRKVLRTDEKGQREFLLPGT